MKIAIIGFGEAARAFASGWQRSDAALVAAYDRKVKNSAQREEILSACKAEGVLPCQENSDAVAGANLIFSLVTADQALAAAQEAAASVEPGALYFDCNSCSPGTKNFAARMIEDAGGHYVDVAVMAPVSPQGHLTPLLISGPHAQAALQALERLGMKPKLAGGMIGQASSIKMLRSVMVKGFEALTAESLLAARAAGVEEVVIASLQASDPGVDWHGRSAYNLERMMAHGARRAAEMREVAATVRELGLPDRMATAIADWQEQVAALSISPIPNGLGGRSDAILERLRDGTEERSA